jgi:hypothetical protein
MTENGRRSLQPTFRRLPLRSNELRGHGGQKWRGSGAARAPRRSVCHLVDWRCASGHRGEKGLPFLSRGSTSPSDFPDSRSVREHQLRLAFARVWVEPGVGVDEESQAPGQGLQVGEHQLSCLVYEGVGAITIPARAELDDKSALVAISAYGHSHSVQANFGCH